MPLLSWHPKRLHSLRQRQSTSMAANSEAEAQNNALTLLGANCGDQLIAKNFVLSMEAAE
jgi:hypothetical protein